MTVTQKLTRGNNDTQSETVLTAKETSCSRDKSAVSLSLPGPALDVSGTFARFDEALHREGYGAWSGNDTLGLC